MKPILSVAEAAELLQCSEESVQIAARARKLPGVKYGKDWVFSLRALEEVVFSEGMDRYQFEAHVPDADAKPAAHSVTVPEDGRRAANSSRARPRPALMDFSEPGGKVFASN